MKPRLLLFAALPFACTQAFVEPPLTIAGLARRGTAEAAVCNAHGFVPERGWLVEITGTGFFVDPGELDGPVANKAPAVVLEGPERYALPDASVGVATLEKLVFEAPTSDSVPAHTLMPGVYDVVVTTGSGRTARAARALIVVAPPLIDSVEVIDTGTAVPIAGACLAGLHRFRLHGRNLAPSAAAPMTLATAPAQLFTPIDDSTAELETTFRPSASLIYLPSALQRAGCSASTEFANSYQSDFPYAAPAGQIWTLYWQQTPPLIVSETIGGHVQFNPLQEVVHRSDGTADYRVPVCATGQAPPACVPSLVSGGKYLLDYVAPDRTQPYLPCIARSVHIAGPAHAFGGGPF